MDSLTQLDDQIMKHWDDVDHLDCLVDKFVASSIAPKVLKRVDNFVLKATLDMTYPILDTMLVFVQNKQLL